MCNTRTDNQIINIYNSLRTSGLRGAEHLPSSLTDISEGFKPQLIYVISALEMMLFNKWSDTNENNEITL
jgi:hypothetical protein